MPGKKATDSFLSRLGTAATSALGWVRGRRGKQSQVLPGQNSTNYNALVGLLQAFRSNAPGAWTDDRMEQARHYVGINYLAIHPKAMQASRAEIKVYERDPRDP